jgi:pyridoxal phosphate enzyme (YggS family)
MGDIAANWQRIRTAIDAAARRAGRNSSDVRVIAASKTKDAQVILEAIDAGVRDFGENYVQEAEEKIELVRRDDVRWHMIGHLQRNKAGRAVELFDTIQSVDSVALGRLLARQGAERQRAVRILLEINLGGEGSKNGVSVSAASQLMAALADCEWISIEGLMTVPPALPAEAVRRFFRELRCLRDGLSERGQRNAPLRELSMGMTDDFAVAVEEGATMVRIGRGLLGARRPKAEPKSGQRRSDEEDGQEIR